MISRFLVALTASAGVTALATACPGMAIAQTMAFDIRPGSLQGALDAWASQSRRQVIYRVDEVRAARSPGVRGPVDAERALAALLEGSGFIARTDASGAVAIVRQESAPGEAGAGGDATDLQDSEIIVTGTNLRGAQPTSPLITISRRQIDESGATAVEELMRKLPQNFGGGVSADNLYAFQPGIDNVASGEGLNLRGLGQRATLTLVNGRRLAPGAGGTFVDISLIPITAVERVEILTDGASAIYGSDAVGGVVNFILRDDFQGLETVARVGSASNGDGDQLQLGVTGGHAWSGGHALLSYEYRREDEILVRDRDFTIGQRPDAFFLPRERRHSILGLVEQELTDALTVELNGSWATRRLRRTLYNGNNPLPVTSNQRGQLFDAGGEARLDLGRSWIARAQGLYSRSTSDSVSLQPGGFGVSNVLDTRTEIYGFGLKADGDLFELPAGALKLAIGAESRWESYRESFLNGAGLREVASNRDVQSVFAEVLLPVFSSANRRPGFERLQLSAAARYDDYGGLGSSFDPKVGVLWSPIPDLALRASFGTSFRAPLLSETTGSYIAVYTQARFLYADPTQASGTALITQGFAPGIRPETSRTWTFGGELTPRFAPGLTLSANYYAIRFSDRIASPLTNLNVIGNPAFESLVTRNPTAQQVIEVVNGAYQLFDGSGVPGVGPGDITVILDSRTTNTAVTTTRGMDFGGQYQFDLGTSRFILDANVNHIISFNDRITESSPEVSNFNIPHRPLAWRGRFGLSWTRGPLGGSIALNHAGGYRERRTGVERPVDSFTTLDAGLTYNATTGFLRGTRVSLFVDNLLDTDPPFLPRDPISPTGPGYDPVNASGRGRFFSLQIRKAW